MPKQNIIKYTILLSLLVFIATLLGIFSYFKQNPILPNQEIVYIEKNDTSDNIVVADNEMKNLDIKFTKPSIQYFAVSGNIAIVVSGDQISDINIWAVNLISKQEKKIEFSGKIVNEIISTKQSGKFYINADTVKNENISLSPSLYLLNLEGNVNSTILPEGLNIQKIKNSDLIQNTGQLHLSSSEKYLSTKGFGNYTYILNTKDNSIASKITDKLEYNFGFINNDKQILNVSNSIPSIQLHNVINGSKEKYNFCAPENPDCDLKYKELKGLDFDSKNNKNYVSVNSSVFTNIEDFTGRNFKIIELGSNKTIIELNNESIEIPILSKNKKQLMFEIYNKESLENTRNSRVYKQFLRPGNAQIGVYDLENGSLSSKRLVGHSPVWK